MAERKITLTLPEELYQAIQRQDGDLEAFVRGAVMEKLAAAESSEEGRGATPLLEKFTQGLEGKDLDQLVRAARSESENRIIGQGVAHLALFISQVMMETAAFPFTEGDRTRATSPSLQRASPSTAATS